MSELRSLAGKRLRDAVGVEPRGQAICGRELDQPGPGWAGEESLVSELRSSGKSFEITKLEVWLAWEKVKANKGASGVDEVTLEAFEADLRSNLYRIWNRMSSGSYFPSPVKAVEIPKPHAVGTRVLGLSRCSRRPNDVNNSPTKSSMRSRT
ncbi:reverse transcriptase [Saccharopolyspora spinosa]|uniref:reverse transcriptase n=1 Tax=Saccharopolyspora spinosa TaxID=60894 RepID=UPI00178C71DB|nr:reverse transcriptase [Saccharopolyspora spinosa]